MARFTHLDSCRSLSGRWIVATSRRPPCSTRFSGARRCANSYPTLSPCSSSVLAVAFGLLSPSAEEREYGLPLLVCCRYVMQCVISGGVSRCGHPQDRPREVDAEALGRLKARVKEGTRPRDTLGLYRTSQAEGISALFHELDTDGSGDLDKQVCAHSFRALLA